MKAWTILRPLIGQVREDWCPVLAGGTFNFLSWTQALFKNQTFVDFCRSLPSQPSLRSAPLPSRASTSQKDVPICLLAFRVGVQRRNENAYLLIDCQKFLERSAPLEDAWVAGLPRQAILGLSLGVPRRMQDLVPKLSFFDKDSLAVPIHRVAGGFSMVRIPGRICRDS